MIKLRRINVSGFRGARYPLIIDLENSCRSIAIFGENAAGKSTVTDGVEWFFKDRIDHLWREDCKEEALRNVHLNDDDDATVCLEFSDDTLSCEKSLSSALKISKTNTKEEFNTYKAKAADERIVLRTSDLINFLEKSKGEKRKALADIIGYESLIEFRDLIQKAENTLQKDGDYTHAIKSQDEAKASLIRISGSLPVREKELFEKAYEIVKPSNPSVVIADEKSYQECIGELTKTVGRKEEASKQFKLKELNNCCDSVIKGFAAAKLSAETFLSPYNTLIADKERIKFLDIEHFLSKGRELIDKGLAEPQKCPFCGSKVDLEHVKEEVIRRVGQLEQLRKSFENTRVLKDQWVVALKEIKRLIIEFQGKCAGLGADPNLLKDASTVTEDTAKLLQVVNESFEDHRPIEIDKRTQKNAEGLTNGLRARMQRADQEVKELKLTSEEQTILSRIQTLKDLKASFDSYQRNAHIRKSFEEQIKTLAKIKERFITVQARALQEVLDVMSDDIRRYYLALHPKENIGEVKLRIVGEEGVEFEYSFHGKTTYPPKKYLSESHLNSLGIALFLSSAKLFNRECKFLLLDDVVTSFDSGHRLRLLRLLEDEFNDWQIVLLTHQRHWFEIIKRELGGFGWLIGQVDWSEENGIRLKESPKTLRELITLKRSQGHDVSNDIRTLLEEVLKDISNSLQVMVPFRYNEKNEERRAGELLSDLRGTLKKRSSALRDDPIFTQIGTSNLLGTMGSHDRPRETSAAELDVALEDIDKLEQLFRCECGHLVSRENFIESEKRIKCKCGKKSIPWMG